ncbi:MAG: hypothetical protein EOP56_03025 [Sphingobacteriales bacterium]|nr:MAG: hypothetical protein EOP56_03025 [Sphingobacteriales bacterium]
MRLKQGFLFAALVMVSQNVIAQSYVTGPQAIVYKTKKDYNKLVPVTLSEDKSQIVSYPHPSDVKIDDKLATPTQLKKGYLLDNRGINKNVAFLRMTYSEYAALSAPPSTAEMYAMIVDKDPIAAMCECGLRSSYKSPKKELNKLISKKRLKTTCKTVK